MACFWNGQPTPTCHSWTFAKSGRVRAACAACGLTFLFNLPVFDDPDAQRVAAAAWQEADDASPQFAFVTLDRDGAAVAVSAQCTCLDHGAAVALAWYDLIETAR